VTLLCDGSQKGALNPETSKAYGVHILFSPYQAQTQELTDEPDGKNTVSFTFKVTLSIDSTFIDFIKIQQSNTPNLTTDQTADYTRYEYKCYDVLHIPGTLPGKRGNDVEIHGCMIRMPDSLFCLFLELVVALKRGNGGWVGKQVDVGNYQVFSNLRMVLQGSLLGKDAQVFIENNNAKKYRISTHPDFITVNRTKLLTHPDARMRFWAEKLPQDCVKKRFSRQ
jgi:hypothetical protein